MNYEAELEEIRKEALTVFAFMRALGNPFNDESDDVAADKIMERVRVEDAKLLSAQKLMREGLTPEKEQQAKEILNGTMLDGLDLQEFIAADTIKKRFKWITVNSPLS